MENYTRFVFQGRTGYVIDRGNTTHGLVALGHTAGIPPWSDPNVHIHTEAEEFYWLLQGQLRFLVGEHRLTLKPGEVLMVRPGTPHAILGGKGPVEHLGIRAPALADKQIVSGIPVTPPPLLDEQPREVEGAWGCRIPLRAPNNRNCWVLGVGQARFKSKHLILAALNFPTDAEANAGIGLRHRPHHHRRSWEYYGVFKGSKTLQIKDELVTIQPGEIVESPPGVCHVLHSRTAPFEGFTFRVPALVE